MVLVEVVGITVFSALVSAWGVYIYPSIRGKRNIPSDSTTQIFAQGACSIPLLPNERDLARLEKLREKQEQSNNKENEDEIESTG